MECHQITGCLNVPTSQFVGDKAGGDDRKIAIATRQQAKISLECTQSPIQDIKDLNCSIGYESGQSWANSAAYEETCSKESEQPSRLAPYHRKGKFL